MCTRARVWPSTRIRYLAWEKINLLYYGARTLNLGLAVRSRGSLPAPQHHADLHVSYRFHALLVSLFVYFFLGVVTNRIRCMKLTMILISLIFLLNCTFCLSAVSARSHASCGDN